MFRLVHGSQARPFTVFTSKYNMPHVSCQCGPCFLDGASACVWRCINTFTKGGDRQVYL